MKNEKLGNKIQQEVLGFIATRKSLQISSITPDGKPYASYAPYALGENHIYVLLSDIAQHAINLKTLPVASVLIIEDEDSAKELFARKRVSYTSEAAHIEVGSQAWKVGIESLKTRHGERIEKLSELADFHLFKLTPTGGRYVKGFGRAYNLASGRLAGELVEHMRDGHKPRLESA
jgi:heme oxygenase (biliverdin-IX-beta and delta-forming)